MLTLPILTLTLRGRVPVTAREKPSQEEAQGLVLVSELRREGPRQLHALSGEPDLKRLWRLPGEKAELKACGGRAGRTGPGDRPQVHQQEGDVTTPRCHGALPVPGTPDSWPVTAAIGGTGLNTTFTSRKAKQTTSSLNHPLPSCLSQVTQGTQRSQL